MDDGKPQPDVALRGNLRIRQDLKRDIKVAAVQRGIHEYQLIEEVWNFWLEYRHKVPIEEGRTLTSGHRNQEEEELCQAVMDFWRDPVSRGADPGGIGCAVLKSFLKRFQDKYYGPKGA